MSVPELTPMMRQYREMKSQAPRDAVLLFHLGDFYEMFFDDAKIGSRVLGLTLTQRNGMPMCGMPFHAAGSHIPKLIAAGYRVALCDQMEAPRPGQVVRRQITRILSPGSVIDSEMLPAARPHFLAAVCGDAHGIKFGLAFLDSSTGDFRVTELEGEGALRAELIRLGPAECLCPDDLPAWSEKCVPSSCPVSRQEGWTFEGETARGVLKELFGLRTLESFGCEELPLAIGAAGAMVHYLSATLRRPLKNLRSIKTYSTGEFMMLDETTRATLELVEPSRRGAPAQHTLLGVLDRTRTGMGARRIRDWVLHPLRSLEPLLARQKAVAFLLDDLFPLEQFSAVLDGVRDVERIVGRLVQGVGSGRDLLALKESLEQIPQLHSCLGETIPALLATERDQLHPLPSVCELITRAIALDCPVSIREGGVIREGFDASLDELRKAGSEGRDWIAALQTREQEATGIKSLKIRYNSVFGYYIELTKSHVASAPDRYHRKQTTSNAERFITPELKEMENKILGAEERARELELDLLEQVKTTVLVETDAMLAMAAAVGRLDALASLAQVARANGYCRPELLDQRILQIKEGRHPVLELLPMEERFVPNDTDLNGSARRLMILTGPNMAGKSTFLRQTALLALMAHVGSWIPATSARIGILDRIFTRVGASDDLHGGRSTFLVEMDETSHILHHATDSSLIVLDEIGRGTSTFDGLSIAWAVAEHLHNEVKALTLFATHYHETTTLARHLNACVLMNVAVREWGDQIIFLRKVLPGAADKSYGIQVARLAGLPAAVLDRARTLLGQFEDGTLRRSDAKPLSKTKKHQKPQAHQQDLFLTPETGCD